MHYESGIVKANKCKGKNLDHAVLAAGWAHSGTTDYVITKNSWGTDWGEKGYIRLEFDGREGACGVLEEPILPHTNWNLINLILKY